MGADDDNVFEVQGCLKNIEYFDTQFLEMLIDVLRIFLSVFLFLINIFKNVKDLFTEYRLCCLLLKFTVYKMNIQNK